MSNVVETDIPARLDRLPWSRFHTGLSAASDVSANQNRFSRAAMFASCMFAALWRSCEIVALRYRVAAERKPLEEVARPLASAD